MKSIYDEILLERNLYPRNKGRLEGSTLEKELTNASCGDRICVQLKIQDNLIVEGKFDGVGCAIALAAADLMIDSVRGKTMEEAKEMGEMFREMILSPETFKMSGGAKKIGDSSALEVVARMPARVKCAELAWQIFKGQE